MLIPHALLTNFKAGLAKEEEIHILAFRLNLGSVLVEGFEGDEASKTMSLALDALQSVKDRYNSTGKAGATGEEYNLIFDGLNLTDDLQANSTRRDLANAMVKVIKVAGVH